MYIKFVLLYLAVQYLSIFVNVIKGNSIFYCGAPTWQHCVFICLLFGNLRISHSFSHQENDYQETAHKHY